MNSLKITHTSSRISFAEKRIDRLAQPSTLAKPGTAEHSYVPGIEHRTGHFSGWNQLPLYYRCWFPQIEPKAIIALVHGLGSHSGLFDTVAHALVPQGYLVYALDLRGHGRSPGQRGYIRSWQEFRSDIAQFVRHIRSDVGHDVASLPLFLIGHSLGGTISLDYAMHHADMLTGVVAIAPALGCVGISPTRLLISKVLSRLWPRFTLNTGINKGAASRNPAVIERYRNDPLRHTKGTARLAAEFLKTTANMSHNAHNLACPLLILHGGADQVTLPESSDRFFQQVTVRDKTRHEYEGSYHDLHHDINADVVLKDLSHWLHHHLR